jgi:hypothetical protein
MPTIERARINIPLGIRVMAPPLTSRVIVE